MVSSMKISLIKHYSWSRNSRGVLELKTNNGNRITLNLKFPQWQIERSKAISANSDSKKLFDDIKQLLINSGWTKKWSRRISQ